MIINQPVYFQYVLCIYYVGVVGDFDFLMFVQLWFIFLYEIILIVIQSLICGIDFAHGVWEYLEIISFIFRTYVDV